MKLEVCFVLEELPGCTPRRRFCCLVRKELLSRCFAVGVQRRLGKGLGEEREWGLRAKPSLSHTPAEPLFLTEASLCDPFLPQHFGHRCSFISSKAKDGRVLGGLCCPSEMLRSMLWAQGCPSQVRGDRLGTSSGWGLRTEATWAVGCGG